MDVESWKRQVFGDAKEEGELWEFDAEVVHDAVLFKDVETCVKEVNADRREVTIAYSAESIDRDGDIIRQKGIDLKAYRKNPIVLFAHGARWGPAEGQLPIARSMKLFRSDDGLKSFSVDRFVAADIHLLGDTVFRMLASSPAFLNAASIGFLPLKVEERELEDDEKERFWRAADFKKVEKLEHSIVPVPANSDALRGAKSAGIDIAPIKTWAEGILDKDALVKDPLLTREHLERCYQIANNNRKTFTVPEIGCGQDEVGQADDKDKGSTPANPSGFTRADEGTSWSAPTLGAFGVTGSFEDLSISERRRIARHFAWAEQMPPTAFGQLKLPHHRASDAAVVLRGVNAALAALNGARGGVDIPSDDRQSANSHLNGHRKAFGQEPIALREMGADEARALLERFAREIAGHDAAACKECRGIRELAAMTAIDAEVGEIINSFDALITCKAESQKEEDVAEKTTTTEEVPTRKVSLGTIELEADIKVSGQETAESVSEAAGRAVPNVEAGTESETETEVEPEGGSTDDVFDVDVKEADPESEPELEGFDFPSIKDEEMATGEPVEIQIAELRQGLRDMAGLVKRLVDVIKVAGSPETEPEPVKQAEGEEAILMLADEPKEEENPTEKVGRFIAEKTAEAVAGAVTRHTGRLPN